MIDLSWLVHDKDNDRKTYAIELALLKILWTIIEMIYISLVLLESVSALLSLTPSRQVYGQLQHKFADGCQNF